jgi:putative peptidoglycan lipid II flippase
MSEKLHESDNAFQRLINHVSGVLAVILLIVTVIGVLASPVFIFIFAPGFDDPEQQVLASDMLKITFPYLLFISLTAMSGSILNIKQRFAVPALTPVLLNISLIAAAILGSFYCGHRATGISDPIFNPRQRLSKIQIVW